MRDKERIRKFLDALEIEWLKAPDLRFGQLVLNVFETSERNPFYCEEKEMIGLFRDYFKEVVNVNDKRNKCQDCDMIAVQHWFEAGTTFKINCSTLDAEKCYKELMERRRGHTGTCGVIPKGVIPESELEKYKSEDKKIKVMCINNNDFKNELEVGKVYTVLRKNWRYYFIEINITDDEGNYYRTGQYRLDRFVEV